MFRGLSPRGLAGDTFFTDGFHPSLIGYTALAEAILRGLHSRRAFGWGEAAPAPVPAVTPSDCARHFGMDPEKWRHVCDYAAWFYGHTAYVRFDPSGRLAKARDTTRRPVGSRPALRRRTSACRASGPVRSMRRAGGEDGRVGARSFSD